VALVRVFRLPAGSPVWSFPYIPGYGGCRSRVKLPEDGKALEGKLTPVMEDAAWEAVAEKVREALG
jgi:hypothetical protein